MIRKLSTLLLLGAGMIAGTSVNAQQKEACATQEVNNDYKVLSPDIVTYENEVNAFIAGLKNSEVLRSRLKGTAFGPNDTLHIPVVVHVVHDYGYQSNGNFNEYVPDNRIYEMMDSVNAVFTGSAGDLVSVIPTFKPYIGIPKIKFHLASKDPKGNPTKGITRRQSYLTYGGDDQAKFDQWDPTSYLNIWIIRTIGRKGNGTVLAYAVFPTSAAAFPYNDGIISRALNIDDDGKTIAHEIGHILGLYHTWGNVTNDATPPNCTGDDEVDDTPPTQGHNTSICPLYDTTCVFKSTVISKQLLDNTPTKQLITSTDIGLTFAPRTNLIIEAVDIYPSTIGDEFTIQLQRLNPGTGTYQPFRTLTTISDAVGKANLSNQNMVTNEDSVNGAINFDVVAPAVIIDNVDIYPAAIGDPFTIAIISGLGDTLKTYNGTTTTNTGKQIVPINAYVPRANNYRMQMINNPGMRVDTFYNTVPNYTKTVSEAITIKDELNKDTTGGINPTNYQGAYNIFYNWDFRHKAITTTDSSAQYVPLGFRINSADTNFRLVVTENPGLYADSIGSVPYVKSIPCVLQIKDDNISGTYNLLYKLQVRYGYIVNCVDYPDTANTQNIMNYVACPIMFTKGQVERMRDMIANNVGGRGNLVEESTHLRTGIISGPGGNYDVRLDLKPVPDFSVERARGGIGAARTYFMCKGEDFQFTQRSWRDTITSVTWSMSNGANIENSGATFTQSGGTLNNTLDVTFSEPGWVDVTLTASGNGTGDSTVTKEDYVYVADPDNAINPQNGFMMGFDPNDANNSLDKWPIFNYYNNDFKWEVSNNTGFYDNNCIVYKGFDNRVGPMSYTGSPKGDFDDFYTPAFNLTGMNGDCQLNFMSSGAFATTDSRLFRDTLRISYSTDCGITWNTLTNITKGELGNKGTVTIPYAPLWLGDWKLQSIAIPNGARTANVFFRFRFLPGVDDINFSKSRSIPGTGNNFYIDRININEFPLGVNTLMDDNKSIALVPNPTNGSTQLVINAKSNDMADINVTDITGKVVYSTKKQLNGVMTTVDIPASAIQVKGVYMIHVQAGNQKFTDKLVSY